MTEVAHLKVGDTVTAEFNDESVGGEFAVTGPLVDVIGALAVGGWIVRDRHGVPGAVLVKITGHTPAQPPIGSLIRDTDGDYWAHAPEGWLAVSRSSGSTRWSHIWNTYGKDQIEQVKP
jgi:hypothetical protein